MSITKSKYGELNGEDVYIFTLDNKNGLSAGILNYGGIITSLVYEGVDVVFGYDTFEEYLNNDAYYGALIGRNSNRIVNAAFTLNDTEYKLYANNGANNHHGGKIGFDKKLWNVEAVDKDEPALILTLHSPDGDEGFPGNLEVRVTYTLTSDNSVSIHYEGISDADTVMNMTSHCYFNLNGHSSGSVDGHTLYLNSDFYTPVDDFGVPTGEVLFVKDTPLEFNGDDTFAEHFFSEHPQIKRCRGIDHNFAVKGYGYRLAGILSGDKTGIKMETYTDCSGVQIYTANYVETDRVRKGGNFYAPHGAVCVETQCFPNSYNVSHFPNGFLRKGEKYDSTTTYKFSK